MSSPAEFEGWAIVELMGHRRLAGFVREVTMFGEPALRIDIPTEPPATQYYGGKALFSLTPTSEDFAKRVARASQPAHQLTAGSDDDDDDWDDGDRDGVRDSDRHADDIRQEVTEP